MKHQNCQVFQQESAWTFYFTSFIKIRCVLPAVILITDGLCSKKANINYRLRSYILQPQYKLGI